MSFPDDKKKKRRWFKSILILILLILLLILLDGRFGLGDGLFLNSPSGAPDTENSEDEVSTTRSTILINDNNIIYENESILMVTLESIIAEAPENHMFILVDEMANNSLFESVEKLLKDSGHIYTVE